MSQRKAVRILLVGDRKTSFAFLASWTTSPHPPFWLLIPSLCISIDGVGKTSLVSTLLKEKFVEEVRKD